jgi:hypothetical protein
MELLTVLYEYLSALREPGISATQADIKLVMTQIKGIHFPYLTKLAS